MCRHVKRNAKKDGVAFDLTKEWICERLEKGCEVTGVPFDLTTRNPGLCGFANVQKYAPSLDRKDNSKGYTKDNVQVVIWMYNAAKHIFSHEDVLEFARLLLSQSS